MDFAPKHCRKPQTTCTSTNSKIFLQANLFTSFSKLEIARIGPKPRLPMKSTDNLPPSNSAISATELTVAIILIAIPLLGFALGMIAAWLA